MLAGVPAFAQDTSQVRTLETVTVTAQKVGSEDVQKVPLSIQVLDSQDLTDLHATDFTTFARYLPSVSYTGGGQGSGGGPGLATISMRGITNGNDGNHSGPLPTVGVYLDEQPITTIGGTLDVPTYDIERVEALAGPQGTLYGASSEAGTIRIITNKPDTSAFAAGYDVMADAVQHGGIGYTLDGFVNLPITDNAAIRIVAWDEHDAGYIDNVHGTRTYPTTGVTIDNASAAKNDYNTVNKLGGRVELGINLDDDWTITPMLMGQLETSDGVFGYDPSVGVLKVQHYYPEYFKDHWYQAALTIQGKIGDFDVTYSGGFMDRHQQSSADYTDYTYWYDTLSGYYVTDNSGNPVDSSQYILGNDHFEKFSNELRIASPRQDRLRFVVGLFQERQTHDIVQDYKINALGSDFWVPGWPNTLWLTDQLRVDRDLAAFGEVSFDILPNLTATGGVRVFQADNSLKGFFGFSLNQDLAWGSATGMASCFAPADIATAPCTNLDKRVKETGETHKVNLTWQIDDQHMVYATYSTGFRPGGINRYGKLPPYQSDQLENYELGWKTSWAGDRVRWNGAVYWENWKDFQFAFLGINSLTQITNGGQAQVQGIESNVSWLVTDGFTLSAAGAFNNARLTSVYCGDLNPSTGLPDTSCTPPLTPNQAPKGQELPSTPRFKGNLIGRYDFQVQDFSAHLQAAAAFQTSSWPDLRNVRTLLGQMPGYTTIDLTGGIGRGNWSLELSIQNVFDARGQVYRYAECTTQVCGYEPYVIVTQPRTIGLTFGQKF
ncbi:MAG: TonB-dependent receptor [Alphaproteobacteria bacterium]|nr:TonB-dependent receptor [Alphaproteobacteria bacterium]